jgi:hypothetical protein
MYMECKNEHIDVEHSAKLYSLTEKGWYLPVEKAVRRIL